MSIKSINFYLVLVLVNLFIARSYSQTNDEPPVLDAILTDTVYCVGADKLIVENFALTDPDNTEVDGIFIQISSGYVQGQEQLNFPTTPGISSTWNSSQGKLSLSFSATNDYSFIEDAIEKITYSSMNLAASGSREFSITLDEANYLPSTDHYYEYISAPQITWSNARTAAANLSYYGLQGYLATITTADEAKLAGEQAGGNGWIGGSDEEDDFTWKWMTGPEAGQSFWFGLSDGNNIGADFTYENWASNEPNNWENGVTGIPHAEDYLHIYPSGQWNDFPNFNNNISGYIVEYGGMPGDPDLNISASTKITIGEIIATVPATDVCGSGTATMTAISSTGIVHWYSTPTSTLSLHVGDTFTTPVITTNTTYYAAPSTCVGGRVAIEVTVFPLPTITTINEGETCESGTVMLRAIPSDGIVNWYDSPSSTTLLSTGTDFTTPIINNSTTYYAEAVANGCISAVRFPVIATVTKIAAPVAPPIQEFCESENALISDLSATGGIINWYNTPTGGTLLDPTTALISGMYYASETINSCEGSARTQVEVVIFESVEPLPPNDIPPLQICDDVSDGDDTNGQAIFDLTINETILLNGKNTLDFSFFYYEDSGKTSPITSPSNYYNITANSQPIYVSIVNNLKNTCITDAEIQLEVVSLPVIQTPVTLKNCDEDGSPDGFTDFNLTEADDLITLNNPNLTVSYYLTTTDAENAVGAVNPAPFNNSVADTVYGRVENSFGCFRIAVLNLEVSTTQFPPGYVYELSACENDNVNDGLATFDLTEASTELLNQLPAGQNLSVQYYRNITDAQLELNEILPQDAYKNEIPFNQTLIVRIENDDNGDCFDIGPFVNLTVFERPEFQVFPGGTVCLNNPPLEMEILNANGAYAYEWKDPSGTIISTSEFAQAFEGGIYSVAAFSAEGCESFTQTITVIESEVANISFNDITIVDDSDNNSISIDDSNLGSGDYEFALDDPNGFYQDEPYFDMVPAGIHTVYVRDKNGCGVVGVEVSIIGFPRFFTPNNDGYNDTWQVSGVSEDFYPTSLIYIFDRFGKLITQIDPRGEGWDGFFNGNILPGTDYWFSVQLIDKNNNIREKKGHFSLIRR